MGVSAAQEGRWGGEPVAPARTDTLRDALLLAAVVAIPAAFYAPGLGFYLDDWGFWAWMRDSADQSPLGLYRALVHDSADLSVRPGQIAWLIACYKLWPYQALPIHLVNHLLFGAGLLLFHASLRGLPRWRSAAFPVALFYASLAGFTAIKMWWGTHQATLSWLFFALSLWLAVRAARSERTIAYAVAIGLSAAASALCYELLAPLLPLLPAFVGIGRGGDPRAMVRERGVLWPTVAAAAGIALVTLFKAVMALGVGMGALAAGRHTPVGYGVDIARMYAELARDSLWSAGLYAPVAALRVAAGPAFDARAAIAGALVLALLLARLRPWRATGAATTNEDASPAFLALHGAGVFVLGYAAFVPNLLYLAGAWGPNNRQNAAAVLGVAMLAWALCLAIARRWPRAAAWALAVLCVSGVFLQVSIGRLWVRAVGEQHLLITQVKAVAPRLKPGRVLLVYGFCPYLRAAPVFGYRGWDLTQALHLNGLPALEADILSPGTTMDALGVIVPDPASHYRRRYRYGTLAVLDRSLGSVTPIDSREAAARYFAPRSLALPTGCAYEKGAGAPLY